MARKTVGYVHMEWTCPSCGSRNLGTEEICSSCGAPQPEDVEFQQAVQETLIADEQLIARAEAGPDVHCPFCGTRNPATAVQCSQCLADLTDAPTRDSGDVVGAHRKKAAPPVTCPACGTENPAGNRKCSQCSAPLPRPKAKKPDPAKPEVWQGRGRRRTSPLLFVVLVVIIAACGIVIFLAGQTEETIGRVANVEWTRSVRIEGIVPVEREDWLDQIPADSEVGACRQEIRYTSPNPEPNGVEVCGTPYTVDTGTGVGEVVQDCEYQVYDDFCTYAALEWRVVDTVSASGSDFTPSWPALQLATDQREGEREESYAVIFDTDGRSYTYRPNSADEMQQFDIGSRWILEINAFNNVRTVTPAGQ